MLRIPSWRESMQNSVQIWASMLQPAKMPVKPLGENGELWAWIGDYDDFLGYMAWMVKALENGSPCSAPL